VPLAADSAYVANLLPFPLAKLAIQMGFWCSALGQQPSCWCTRAYYRATWDEAIPAGSSYGGVSFWILHRKLCLRADGLQLYGVILALGATTISTGSIGKPLHCPLVLTPAVFMSGFPDRRSKCCCWRGERVCSRRSCQYCTWIFEKRASSKELPRLQCQWDTVTVH
jgi:hypothetical protein